MKDLTRNQVARLFKVDDSTISRWRAAGCPVNDDGSYDAHDVLLWLSKNPNRKPRVDDHKTSLEAPTSLSELVDNTFCSLFDDGDVVGVINLVVELVRASSAGLEALLSEPLID